MARINATLPDCKTSLHLFGRENEIWYGILIKSNSANTEEIESKLTKILTKDGHSPAQIDGEWIYSKGTYDSKTKVRLREYLESEEKIIGEPIMGRGRYFFFLGFDWLEKYKRLY